MAYGALLADYIISCNDVHSCGLQATVGHRIGAMQYYAK